MKKLSNYIDIEPGDIIAFSCDYQQFDNPTLYLCICHFTPEIKIDIVENRIIAKKPKTAPININAFIA